MILEISSKEIEKRQKLFFEKMQQKNAEVAILFSTTDIFYLTGFQFRPSERPIAFFVDE
ncbi:aminopeptidase P family N-terminal domain-containing protein [Virgibacillus oceani]